ncbi:hypothetical protein PoB_007425600 [Plakobranchus ocellatus]|uniref:Uncharacterized protein n=1 Tax=Plakobranchus ocellatus TaxID=259542 RepID=A0AAV4DUJ6_9GAST|nr:hypothetical protein PoB_007425600 [Plakobranchus ocellatus]
MALFCHSYPERSNSFYKTRRRIQEIQTFDSPLFPMLPREPRPSAEVNKEYRLPALGGAELFLAARDAGSGKLDNWSDMERLFAMVTNG